MDVSVLINLERFSRYHAQERKSVSILGDLRYLCNTKQSASVSGDWTDQDEHSRKTKEPETVILQ